MRTDYIDRKLYDKLYILMSYDNALALRCSLETGMRIGDVLKLKRSDISGRTITYIAEKTGKKGKAVISQDLANRLLRREFSEWIFPHRLKADKHRTRQAVWKDVKKAAARLKELGELGDQNVAPHSGRKTFAVDDFKSHGLPHTQRALQHDSKGTTMIYAFADELIGEPPKYQCDEYLRKIYKKITKIEQNVINLEHFLSKLTKKNTA